MSINPKNLLDSDSDSDSDGGAQLKVNKEYAQRFEHNKKREERQRLEEKYKNQLDESEDSEDDVTEDDDGMLVDDDVDARINAALTAIRNKDPRIYDKSTAFFNHNGDSEPTTTKPKAEKPVFLKDYHRERILKGDVGADDDDGNEPQTYVQEQAALKKSIVSEFHAAVDDDDDDGDDFIKRKKTADVPLAGGVHPSRAAAIKITELDVANADKDPELFLSNFMASRAWVPEDGSNWKPFESDEEDNEGNDVNRAEAWEHAYNLRFEDPNKSNEVLTTYSRNLANDRSVRREEKTSRRRQREAERERKEAEKQSRLDEKARLRKLKLEEAEKKLRQIKDAAGIRGKALTDEEWIDFLDDEWDDSKWEEAMRLKFGDQYYEEKDEAGGDGKKPKKPKWDDDIDITDIVPDFEQDELEEAGQFDDEEFEGFGDDDDDDDSRPSKKRRTTKDRKKDRLAAKKEAKNTRSKLEALVDVKMGLEHHDLLSQAQADGDGDGDGDADDSSKPRTFFRYRETSPQSFGLSTDDILLAPSDAALNQFAGIKKLAAFRDTDKKSRDKKRMGKKMYLRSWRRDVFGREYEHSGPTYGFAGLLGEAADVKNKERGGKGVRAVEEWDADEAEEKRKSKKRKRAKAKGAPAAAETEI